LPKRKATSRRKTAAPNRTRVPSGSRAVAAREKIDCGADEKNPQKNPDARGGLPSHLTPGNPGNSGGKKGRSGRPPKAFIELSKEIVESAEFQNVMWEAATDPADANHRFYAEKAMAYAIGQPKQTVQHGADERFGKLLESLVGASQQ
jgi:hypothetical protein